MCVLGCVCGWVGVVLCMLGVGIGMWLLSYVCIGVAVVMRVLVSVYCLVCMGVFIVNTAELYIAMCALPVATRLLHVKQHVQHSTSPQY